MTTSRKMNTRPSPSQSASAATRRSSIKHSVGAAAATVAVLLTTAMACAADLPDKPNVLFIAVDDLRPELGCYGAEHIHSPNIDRLASEGLVFDRAYCQQAVCGPSRASLLTGLRPDTIKVTSNLEARSLRTWIGDTATLPQHFKNHGDAAVGMGKIYHAPDSESWTQYVDVPWTDAHCVFPESLALQKRKREKYAAARRAQGLPPRELPPHYYSPVTECADVPDNAGGNMKVGIDGTIPTNNAPLRAAKGSNYEGGVRVPLMIRVPGMTKPGTTSDVVISTVDQFVSLTELLEIPFPEEQVTDGESYVRALKGETYERGPLYSIFPHYGTSDGSYPSVSVRQGPWKLYKIFYDREGQTHRYELYNLREDIGETRNLVDEMPERARKMAALMETHIKEAGYLLPQKNKNYGGNVAAGWLGSKDTRVSVKDKILSVQSHGKEPWVETRYTPLVGGATFALEFEMKSTSSGSGAVSWSGGSTAFDGIHDGNWHSYRVEIPLTGGLGNLRIHPSSAPGEIQLRNIRLETADGHYVRDWPLY